MRPQIYHEVTWFRFQSLNNKAAILAAMNWINKQVSGYKRYKMAGLVRRNNKASHKAYYSHQVHSGVSKLAQITYVMKHESSKYALSENQEVMYAAFCWLRSQHERYAIKNYVKIKHNHKVKFKDNKSDIKKLLERAGR